MTIDGNAYAISASDYTYKSTADNKCYVRFATQINERWIGRWILGLPFLYRYAYAWVSASLS